MKIITLTMLMLGLLVADSQASKRELLLFEDFSMVTVVSKKEQRISASPVSVSVIDEREIKLSGAKNIPELLRRVVGVDVLAISATDINVSFRGFNQDSSDKVLVMIDGRSMYLDFYGIVLWDALPISMEEIKRIELVRGPGSSIYGGNAFSGVINIITKSPGEIDGNIISIRAGEDDTFIGSMIHAESKGEIGYKIAVSRDQYDEWNEDAQRYSTSGNFAVEKRLGGERKLLFSGSIDDSKGESINALDNFIRETTQSHLMFDYHGAEELNFKLFWNRVDATVTGESVLPASFPNAQYDIETNTYEAELTKVFKAEGLGSLLVGGNYSINRIDSLMFGGRHEQKLYGLFIEDEYHINSRLTAIIGGRYDHHPLVGGNFSPRAGLVYSLAEDHHVRLSYTTAYGLPTFVQSYLDQPIPAGNEELDVEKIESWNLGYTGKFADRLKFTADLFYNETEDFIRWPETLPGLYANRESFETYGVELGLDIELTRSLELILNYAWLDIEYTGGAYKGDRFRESPESKINAGLNYSSDKVYGSIFVHYVDETRWPRHATSNTAAPYGYTEKVDDYTIVNANIGYRIRKNLEISMNGFNVFDKRHKEFPMGDPVGRRFTVKMSSKF